MDERRKQPRLKPRLFEQIETPGLQILLALQRRADEEKALKLSALHSDK